MNENAENTKLQTDMAIARENRWNADRTGDAMNETIAHARLQVLEAVERMRDAARRLAARANDVVADAERCGESYFPNSLGECNADDVNRFAAIIHERRAALDNLLTARSTNARREARRQIVDEFFTSPDRAEKITPVIDKIESVFDVDRTNAMRGLLDALRSGHDVEWRSPTRATKTQQALTGGLRIDGCPASIEALASRGKDPS